MAYDAYSWSKLTGGTPTTPPLVAPIDPQHANPTPDPNLLNGQTPSYVNTAPAPDYPNVEADLPSFYQGGNGMFATAREPEDPNYGVGSGPGLTQDEASEIRAVYNNRDFGTPAALNTLPMTDRYDGSGPHVAIIPDQPGDGDSPQTLQLQRTGVGQPNDPYARNASRQKRWWDRIIDMHWFEPSMRPITPRVAYGAPVQPPSPAGGPLASPFPTSVSYSPGAADRFVTPTDRVVPEPWDTNMITSGSADSPLGAQPWGSM